MSTFEIKMPKLGESITEGTIISWMVKVGDIIEEDDVLFEVNTAKVSAEIPSPVAGKVVELFFNEGDTVAVGTVVALVDMEATGTGVPDIKIETDGKEETAETPKPTSGGEEKVAEVSQITPVAEEAPEDDRWYSPVVLAKAKEAGLDKKVLAKIPGTGYQGRLTKRDMEAYLESKKKLRAALPAKASEVVQKNPNIEKAPLPPVQADEGDVLIPMDPVRRIIADRMVASKKISPHVTTMIEADVTRLVKWRKENKEEFRKQTGVNLTYMPVIAEAVVHALRTYPRVNSSVEGYTIIEKKQINVGIAVSLDDGNLIVPVVKNADKLNLYGLATEIASLAGKARNKQLTPGDIQGGTFTITNFGSFQNLFGTPIINQPEVAILGVGVIEKKAVVIETTDGDVIAIRHRMYLSLSYDHRVVDGALGGNFLKSIADYLENRNPGNP